MSVSWTPMGLCVLGFGLLLVWFHGTRLRAAMAAERLRVPREELDARHTFLRRFSPSEKPGNSSGEEPAAKPLGQEVPTHILDRKTQAGGAEQQGAAEQLVQSESNLRQALKENARLAQSLAAVQTRLQATEQQNVQATSRLTAAEQSNATLLGRINVLEEEQGSARMIAAAEEAERANAAARKSCCSV